MRIEFEASGGLRTRVLLAGNPSAYPILLVHGFGLSADTWLRNIDALGEDFFVVAPDLVGHGFTDPVDFEDEPPHRKTIEHLVSLVDAYRFERLCISGSSYGALIGALLYLSLPHRVDKLIINGSGSCFNTEEELSLALQGAYENAGRAFRNPTLDTCRTRMRNTVYDPTSVPEELLHVQLTAYALPWAAEAWEQAIRGMMQMEKARPHRIYERLEDICVDTLVVWGRQDQRGRYDRAVGAVGRMPRASLLTFEKCGHMPYMEHADAYNREVRSFLTSSRPEDR
jgi:2-hydroxy-6-oxonona-2,4-dienedioate hydrolase